jgi:hypothetical protein
VVVELIVLGPVPLEALHLFTGTASVDPELGLRSVLDEGATQIVDGGGATLATVFRSRGIEVPSEILRLTGSAPRPGWSFWTEAYLPSGAAADASARGLAVVEAIAAAAGATVVRPGVGRDADVRGTGPRGSVSG